MGVTLDTSVDIQGVGVLTVTLTAGAITLNASANLLILSAGWGVSSVSTSHFNDARVNGVSVFANLITRATDGNFEGTGSVYQKNPVTGSSEAYVADFNFGGGVAHCWLCASSYIGADVAGTTFSAAQTNFANNSSGTLGPFSSVSGDLTYASIGSDANATITPGATQIQEEEGVGSSPDSCYGSQYSLAVSPTMTYTCSSPDTGWVMAGFVIKAPATTIVDIGYPINYHR